MTVTNAWLGLEEVSMQTNTTIGCTRRPGLCLNNIGLIPYTGVDGVDVAQETETVVKSVKKAYLS